MFNSQTQHDELETKFLEERALLEAKYQKLYEPLNTKVCMLLIINELWFLFICEIAVISL